MFITSISLKRFTPFVFNDVELLELDTTREIQNIVGSNGSGKSSLLQELNPKPPTRTDFGVGGFKKLTLIHNNIEYQLSSDFSGSNPPHSFIRDGEELNPSGTTNIQEELVRTELGYTPQVHNLCYGKQRLSSIRDGVRETYLLTIHPGQMKLLLDTHVNAERKLRGFKSNLSMLYERRTALINQMIDQDLRNNLQEESNRLNNEIATIVGAIHRLNNQQQNVVSSISKYPTEYPIRKKIERISKQRQYPLYRDISRIHPIEEIKNTISNTVYSTNMMKDIVVRQIQSITSEIDKYEKHIRQSDAQGAIDLLETHIQSLRSDITFLEMDVLEQPFDIYTIESIPEHTVQLTNMISVFIGYGSRIPSLNDITRIEMKLNNDRFHLSRYKQMEIDLQNNINKIETNIRIQIMENVPNGCHECVLYRQYNDTITRLKNEHDLVSEELRITRRHLTRLNQLVIGRGNKLTQFNTIAPQLRILSSYFREHGFLLIPFKEFDLLTILRQNPSSILVQLQIHYERSRNHHMRIKKQEELARRLSDYDRLKRPSEFGRQFLENIVIEKQIELTSLRERYNSLCVEIQNSEKFLTLLSSYSGELNTLIKEKDILNQQLEYEILRFDHDLCNGYLVVLNNNRSMVISRLAEIDRTLREQDALLARQQEITENITTIETQLSEVSQMERALSPTTGIPYRYMVQFINKLIDTANVFIRSVFSYPFEFINISPGEVLDYRFRMRVGDVSVPDISRCSDAQKDLADLAFRLAQIVQLKQTGYGIYLDEVDKTFDHHHKQRLLNLLRSLTEEHIVSQLFIVGHNLATYGGMQNVETLVLNDNNIILPSTYNTHAKIIHY